MEAVSKASSNEVVGLEKGMMESSVRCAARRGVKVETVFS